MLKGRQLDPDFHFAPKHRPARKIGTNCRRAYDFICSFWETHRHSPSLREIGKAVGLTSSSTVWRHVQTLKVHGLVRCSQSQARSIVPVEIEDTISAAQVVSLITELVDAVPSGCAALRDRAAEVAARIQSSPFGIRP